MNNNRFQAANLPILIGFLLFMMFWLLSSRGPRPALAMESRSLQAASNQSALVSIACPPGVQGVCFNFEASGAANIMGPVTWTIRVVQESFPTPLQCAEATTEVTLTGATGSITLFSDSAPVCPSPTSSGYPFHVSGDWQITGGTGEFSGIVGSGTVRAVILPNGKNSTQLSGSVSY